MPFSQESLNSTPDQRIQIAQANDPQTNAIIAPIVPVETQPSPPPAKALPTPKIAAPKLPKPGVVTLNLNNNSTQDTEIIEWPDGGISLPVKAIAAQFNVDAQLDSTGSKLFYFDPVSQQKVEMDTAAKQILVNGSPLLLGKHGLVQGQGLLLGQDLYVDSDVMAKLFPATLKWDSDGGSLTLLTSRKLKPGLILGHSEENAPDNNLKIIPNPETYHALIEKVYLSNNSTYGYQNSEQPATPSSRGTATRFSSMVDTPTVGLSGSVFRQNYFIKPSFVHYNDKINLQRLDWGIQHEFKNSILSLGSGDAGLSPLISPALDVWGFHWASRNALTPTLMDHERYEYSGKATTGNHISVLLNGREVQNSVAQDNQYQLEPVYLQPQTMNHIEIVEKDDNNQQKTLLDKTYAHYLNILPKGESAYSAFAGRAPLQFYPLLPDQKTPLLAPQSNKWLAGGRYFYGVNDRLTLGVSTAADHIFGQAKSYFDTINPLVIDLTGFSSYQRDSNYFNGESAALTARYQLSNHYQASLNAGISHSSLKDGSLLDIRDSSLGNAQQLRLERIGEKATMYVDAFNYSSYFYSPSVSLYGNNQYDKRGLSAGINGALKPWVPVNYSVSWSKYLTNLEHLIEGGTIDAKRWTGLLSTQLTPKNTANFSINWLNGDNNVREFQQHNLSVGWATRSLPWGLQGNVNASHYYTNTLFLPSRLQGNDLIETNYTNNSIDTNLDIPVLKGGVQHLKLGNRLSTYVNYGFVQGQFQYKKLFMEPLIQLSYGDRPQTQNRMGVKVGYQFRSGSRLSVAYYRYASEFKSSQSNLASANVKTNQFLFDFADVFGMFGHGVQALGPAADSLGLLTGLVFADYTPNGKPDRNEPGVKHVQLLLDKQTPVITDELGRYHITALPEGYHTLEILPDSLPLSISTENPVYRVKVSGGKLQKLNIPLSVEGGSLDGTISLQDIQGKPLPVKDLMLVLKNERDAVVNYTVPADDGSYKFSNIPNGRYQIDLEPQLKNSGRYRILESPSPVDLAIPHDYQQMTKIRKLDMKVLSL